MRLAGGAKRTPTARVTGYNHAQHGGTFMTKTVRIENADANSSVLRITTQYRNADNEWVDSPADCPVVLGHPTASLTDTLGSRKRFIVEEQ